MLNLTLRIINQVILGIFRPVTFRFIPKGLRYDVHFRCWPTDMDLFMHMNNASYIRVAELSRWRIFYQTDYFKVMKKKDMIGLVVDQKVTYQKQLMPFSPYIVRTTCTTSDNKWIHYQHVIQKPCADDEPKPYVYAVVDCKVVLKQKTGRTVKIDELSTETDFYKDLYRATTTNETKQE